MKDDDSNCSPAVHQLALGLSVQVKSLIHGFEKEKKSVPELKLANNCSPKSKQLFIKQVIAPALEAGLIERTHADNPQKKKKKYFLTELGLEVLEELNRHRDMSEKE